MSFSRKVRRKAEAMARKCARNPGHLGALMHLREMKAPERSAEEQAQIEETAEEFYARIRASVPKLSPITIRMAEDDWRPEEL